MSRRLSKESSGHDRFSCGVTYCLLQQYREKSREVRREWRPPCGPGQRRQHVARNLHQHGVQLRLLLLLVPSRLLFLLTRRLIVKQSLVSPSKHAFDVTSVGQCSSTWPCKLGECRDDSYFECKLLVHNLGCDKFNELIYQLRG